MSAATELLELRRRIEELTQVVRKYARHDRTCPAILGKCSCGLDALILGDAMEKPYSAMSLTEYALEQAESALRAAVRIFRESAPSSFAGAWLPDFEKAHAAAIARALTETPPTGGASMNSGSPGGQ